MRKKVHGFFLLELSLGLSLIALIISLALPPLVTFQATLVKMELYKIHQFFLYCRQRAMSLNQVITLSFDAQHNVYYNHEYNQSLSASIIFGFPQGTYGPPSKPTTPLQKPITFEKNQIVFYPDGSLSSGALYLTDKKHSCCYALTVPTASECCLRMYHYNKNIWQHLNEYS